MNWDIIFPKPQMCGNGKIKIACIGDSITYGYGVIEGRSKTYPALLSQMLGEEYTVKNFGVCNRTAIPQYPYGYKFSGMFGKVKRFKPNIVVICLGTNDSKPYCWNEENFRKAYKDIICKFSTAKVIACLPPPCFHDTNPNPKHIIDGKIIETTLAETIKAVALECGATVVDLHTALLSYKQYLPDGVHPNASGNEIIAQEIYKAINLTEIQQ